MKTKKQNNIKKIQINISNKTFYTIVVVVALIALSFLVYAQTTPNPGHPISQIEPPSGCNASQVLQWTGSVWNCTPLDVPKAFVGITNVSYNGAGVGGYQGGDDKCIVQYGPRARMCVGTDFANGRPTSSGWYNTFGFPPDTTDVSGPTIYECGGWTQSSGTIWDGPYWTISGGARPSFGACETSQPILCCR